MGPLVGEIQRERPIHAGGRMGQWLCEWELSGTIGRRDPDVDATGMARVARNGKGTPIVLHGLPEHLPTRATKM